MASFKNRWNPTEAREQKAFVKWFRLQYPDEILFSIPNHLVHSPAQAINEFSMGMMSGIPDIAICAPRRHWHGLFVEMKRREGGVVSDVQNSVIARLNASGYYAVVCEGWHAAMKATQEYMNIPLSR